MTEKSRIELFASAAIDCGLKIHKQFGPGLLESVYETVLADSLAHHGFHVERQKPIDIEFEGRILRDGFRLDLLIEECLIIELKASEQMLPLYSKQLLTYLRLTNRPLGLLMNFGLETMKDGLRRVANNYQP